MPPERATIPGREVASYSPDVATTRPRRRAAKSPTPPVAPLASGGTPDGDVDVERDGDVEEASGAGLVSPENRATLHHALGEAARLLRSDGAMAYLLDPSTGILRFVDDAGITDDRRRRWVRTLEVEPGVGLFGQAVADRRIHLTGDYPSDPSFVHFAGADRLVRTLAIRSFLVAPLIVGDRVFGAMGTYSGRFNAFGEHDVALVRALADHAAAAMANAELIEQLARSRAELERRAEAERALRQIGARITAVREPAEVLQLAVDEAARLLAADGARIDLLDPNDGALYWAYDAATGRRPGLGPIGGSGEAKAGEGISGRAVREMRPVFTGDYLDDDRFEHASLPDAHVRKHAIRSVLAVPLVGDRGPLGTLTVYTGEVDAFDEADARLLEALAGQAAIAMTNAGLIERLAASQADERRRADEERALREIAARITAIRDPSNLLQDVVDEAARLLGAERVRIDLIGRDAVRVGYTFMGAGPQIGGAAVDEHGNPYLFGASGKSIVERRTIVIGDYASDESFEHVPELDRAVSEDGVRSLVITPLIAEDALLGVLQVGSADVDAFGSDQVGLVEALAHQAAIAIHNSRLIAELDASSTELARRAEAEQSLREIAAQITATRDTGALLQQVVDAATRLVGADGSVLDLVDPGGGQLRWAFDSGVAHLFTEEEIANMTIPVGVGATGQAVAENRVITASDDPQSMFPDSDINDRFFDGTGFRSMIVAPVSGESGPLGALEVYAIRPGAFDDDDAGVIRSLAAQAAIAITNARLIEELKRSQVELGARAETERSLRDISARITSLGDPSEILARVVEESRRLLRSDGAHLTRMSEDGTYLVPVIVAGGMDVETESWLKNMTFPLGGGINGLAAAEIRPVWTGDYPADPRIPHERGDDDAAARLGLRAMAAAPLRAPAGEVIGTLAISYAEPREIMPDELDLLQGLADQAAIALTNSNLYELLGESEARYRHLVQDSPDLVWSIDSDARFTFVSDTCQRLTGWSAGELLGRHFGALVHESSREVAEIDWTAGIADEGGGDRELRGRVNLLHRDGHPVPAEFVAFATRDEDGRFAGANGSVRDMSERDRLERELRESEHRFRFLIENSPDIIFAVDADGRFSYMSDTTRRSLGYEPDQLVGRPFTDLIVYEPGQEAGSRFSLMRDDPTLELTNLLMLRHADGRTLPFEVSSVGLRRDGKFAGIQGAARDVTERERLERELRESEERYRFLVENSPDIIFSTDAEGVFTYVSDSIERITGFTPAEYMGRHFSLVVDPPSLPAAGERWAALLADPVTRQVVKLELRRKGGGTVPVEVSSIGTTVNGIFTGIHGATRDIGERERLERDLRRQAGELASSQERAHLARELHDSVTQALFSMTLVTRSIELLIDRDAAAARAKLTSLRELQREALAEMRALIFELRPGNLENDGLLPALRTHSAALQGRIGLPVVVTSELTDRLPLEVEEVLYRIAQEALHNIVKHAAARQVEVAVDRRGPDVVLRIRDDGKGFDAAAVPDGHLGLAGMRARADKIGATYTVTSRAGAGTTVEVSVPPAAIDRAAGNLALAGIAIGGEPGRTGSA